MAALAAALALLSSPALAAPEGCDNPEDYAAYIRSIESGRHGYSATNPGSSATGAYQFVIQTLKDLGYIAHIPGPASRYFGNSDWSDVVWTGKDGVWSRADFKANHAAQDRAFAEFTQRNLDAVRGSWTPGQVVNGVPLTAGGVAAAAHMLGTGGFQQWARSGFSASGLNATHAANHGWTQQQYLNHIMGRVARGGCMDPGSIDISEITGAAGDPLPEVFLMPWDSHSRPRVILPGSLHSAI